MSARVLVIDDSPMLVELTVKSLLSAGLDAQGATDLASLDQRLTTGPFDVILVDVNMPEMFGDDVVEFLKGQRAVTAKTVLYSDLPEGELRVKAKSSGADAFLTKSSGVEGMLELISNLLGLTLPSQGSTPPGGVAAASPSAPKPAVPRRKRILVVDDSETTIALLEAELSAKGFEVHTADTADKATKIILKKNTRPDLVLLDVRMPNVNGEQFCRFIKSNSLFAGIKVLLCSGENVEELQRICREAGADGFVPKDAVLSKVLSRELGPSSGS